MQDDRNPKAQANRYVLEAEGSPGDQEPSSDPSLRRVGQCLPIETETIRNHDNGGAERFAGKNLENRRIIGADGGNAPFPDAEVLSLHLDREGQNGFFGPILKIKIHVFEMDRYLNDKCYYVIVNQYLATFLFCQFGNLNFADFNGQKVIDGFSIKDTSSKIKGGPDLEVTFFPFLWNGPGIWLPGGKTDICGTICS